MSSRKNLLIFGMPENPKEQINTKVKEVLQELSWEKSQKYKLS